MVSLYRSLSGPVNKLIFLMLGKRILMGFGENFPVIQKVLYFRQLKIKDDVLWKIDPDTVTIFVVSK